MKKTTLFIVAGLLTVFVNAQYSIPPVTGTECTKITQAQIRLYQSKATELLNLARQDKETYGTTGKYPASAINFYDNAKFIADTVTRMADWLTVGGDHNPAVTTYAEAGWIVQWMPEIINHLTMANWWCHVSAVYNKSKYASCGREKSLQLLAEAVNILTYASRCYIGPYKDVPPCK